jgi:hypothetical protein
MNSKPRFVEVRPNIFEVMNCEPEDVHWSMLPEPGVGMEWLTILENEKGSLVIRFQKVPKDYEEEDEK